MSPGVSAPRVTAVLGPTNTGKTHLAVERMLGHASGMIGFPLRLLARENYDRIVREKGPSRVALITGEERIVPPRPAYFVCTVEAMPLDRPVEFLALDEVQLAADRERGHVFTDRILRARGSAETMLLGAGTARRLIRRLVRDAVFVDRPRLSALRYVGLRKVTRLPARTAVIAFSANDVYALAELMRRKRGGAAVVLGALSPRTRNAQVAMYEAGEVDYLIATDAIGMGLNMDIDHVAFSNLVKFDGHAPRALAPAEVAQIAGRAGRHMNDGSFGATGEQGAFDDDLVEAVEAHRFDDLRSFYWRNSKLSFRSIGALRSSLKRAPDTADLMPVPRADDTAALDSLGRDREIVAMASTPSAVRLLWEVCQIPDFRKSTNGAHTGLLARMYRELMGPAGRLPTDWVARQVDALDRTDGDIDHLTARIAAVRTWTYVSHRADWIDGAAGWQARTRDLEDRLSEALHQRLTQRFVDRRTALLMRRLRDRDRLLGAVNAAGDVLVEGAHVGRLEGFRFRPDGDATGEDARALMTAARRALRDAIAARLSKFEKAPHGGIDLAPDGGLAWLGAVVGRLEPGPSVLHPKVRPIVGDFLEPAQRDRVAGRLQRWLTEHLRRRLRPLYRALEADLDGAARGLVYQLAEGLGTVPRRQVAAQIGSLTGADRAALRRLGISLGAESVWIRALLKPAAVKLRALLWAVWHGRAGMLPPPPGTVSFPVDRDVPAQFYDAIGYRRAGRLAVRADRLDALAKTVRKLSRQGPFLATDSLASTVGCATADLAAVLKSLGYRPSADGDVPNGGLAFESRRGAARKGKKSGQRKGRRRAAKQDVADIESPFAKLRGLGGRA